MVCPLSELEYGFTWVGHIQLVMPGILMAVGVESTTVYGPFQMGANWVPETHASKCSLGPMSLVRRGLVLEGGSFHLSS